MTLREVLAEGTALLKSSDTDTAAIETPRLDATLLLAGVLHTNRAGLILRGTDPVSNEVRQRYAKSLQRRLRGECVAYILGRKEFRGLEFIVNPDVLVPRPDTETLVEAAISYIDGFPGTETCTLLDMCTGSGAVGIALKHERPRITVYASDISAAALGVAAKNAQELLTNGTVHFIESDLFEMIESRFAIITANPPYIPSGMIRSLAPEVRGEPRLSLDGGEEGLELIRPIILGAKKHLHPGGLLLIEGNPRQMSIISKILRNNDYQNVRTYNDLSGQQRVIGAIQID